MALLLLLLLLLPLARLISAARRDTDHHHACVTGLTFSLPLHAAVELLDMGLVIHPWVASIHSWVGLGFSVKIRNLHARNRLFDD